MASVANKQEKVGDSFSGQLLISVLCLLSAAAQPVLASAWLEPPGHAQLINTVSYHSSAGRYDDAGNPVVPVYRRLEVDPYFEFGVTSWLTLGAEPRYQWSSSGSGASAQVSQSMGDIDVFARLPLQAFGLWVTSIQGTAVLSSGYDKAQRPAPGTATNAYEVRFLAGRNLTSKSASYLNFETGYRFGEDGVADQFRFDASLGIKPWRRWLLLEELFVTQSVGDGDRRPGHAYDLVKLQSSAIYSLTEHLGLQLGYERDVEGSNVGLGSTALFALWTRF